MNKKIDMLNGSLWDKLLLFALPLALSGILQQLFNATDSAVVGRFASSQALAAVGSNAAVINLLLNLFVGLSVGTNVVLARFQGERNSLGVKKTVHTSILVALISGVFLLFLGQILAPFLLKLMAAPADILSLATTYLKIYFLGMPFIMTYNFGSAILRSVGDTKRPLYCLIASGVINLSLNVLFVAVFKMSVVGVGLATGIANGVSASLVIYFLIKEKGDIHLNIKEIKIHKDVLMDIVRIGVPAGIQGMIFSLSNVILQKTMNTLGSDVIAGSSAASNPEFMCYYMLNGFSQATVTFSSQNYGAGQVKRCKKILFTSLLLSEICTMSLGVIFLLFRYQIISLFTDKQAVITAGVTRMCMIMGFYWLNVMQDNISSGIRGLGYSSLPAIVMIFGVCGIRLFWVYAIYPMNPTFQFLLWAYAISWIFTISMLSVAYLYVYKKVSTV